jgi:hypothetical protein
VSETIVFEAELRLFRSSTNNSASAYVTLPEEAAQALVAAAMAGQWLAQGRKGNFGSAKVVATIGATTWSNAVFPDKASGSWSMPVKKVVCVAEGLGEGDSLSVRIDVA